MIYEKLNLKNGDILKASHIEQIEEGILSLSEKTIIDESDLNNLLINKCGDVSNYGEFITSLKSEHTNPTFIDLGFIEEVNGHKLTDFSFEITFRIDDKTSAHCAIFGAMPEYSTSNFGIYTKTDWNHIGIAFGYSATPIVTVPIVVGEIYTVKVSASGIDVNGTSYNINPDLNSALASYKNLYLFASNTGSQGNDTPYHNGGTKSIYDFKIYSGSELIRHLKPYVTTRGRSCMYDIINNKEYLPAQDNLIAE